MVKEVKKETKLKLISLSLFAILFLMAGFGIVSAAFCDDPGNEGEICGDCAASGCWINGNPINLEYLTSGEKTCQSGVCSSSTCNYDSVCADSDIEDGEPEIEGLSVSGCSASCDQDSDCPSHVFHIEGRLCEYNGECNEDSCVCGYGDEEVCPDDGWYCDNGNYEYRSYRCESTGCKYDVIDEVICSDDLFCNGEEICEAGVGCLPGTPVDPDDGILCTDDSCNEDDDQVYNVPNDAYCDNGLYCDGAEYCDPQLDCQSDDPIDCSQYSLDPFGICDHTPDSNPFTMDTFIGFTSECDEATDTCTQHNPWDGLTHACDEQCGAECDEHSDCDEHCEGDLLYTGGNCNLLESCDCSWDAPQDCSNLDCSTGLNCHVDQEALSLWGDEYSCVENGMIGCAPIGDMLCAGPWICDTQCEVQLCGDTDYTCYNGLWETQIPLTEGDCNNGIDDDCDGLVDCDDPDCGDNTPPETIKMYGQPRYPVEIKTDDLCYKDGDNQWQCYDFLAPALESIGYVEMPTGDLVYKERGPVLEIIVNLSGLKPGVEYQLSLNGREGNDGNLELGNNCDNPNGPKEGYVHAWECGIWPGGTGQEGFWNFEMAAIPDGDGNYEHTYFLTMPDGHYGIGPTHGFGFGFIVKEAADVPGGSNYPPILMETNGLDWFIEPYTYPLWITLNTAVYLQADDPQGQDECVSGVSSTLYRSTVVNDDYCEDQTLCVMEATGTGDFLEYTSILNIQEDSCHLIEYYSVDGRGNIELTKKQCVYVETDGPVPNKTVYWPRIEWRPNEFDNDTEISYFYPEETAHCWDGTENEIECWKVTLNTSINMECEPSDTHPAPIRRMCFKVDWDGDDVTNGYPGEDNDGLGGYCAEYNGQYMEDGYCCREYIVADGDIHNFKFLEESEHNLEYYCEDWLGNRQYDDEKFKVFGEMWIQRLHKKWNLISVPFDPLNKTPEDVFKLMGEDLDSVWSYDSETKSWYVYRPDDTLGLNNLDEIETGLGYWVMANDNSGFVIGGSLIAPGPITPPSQKVKKGWNLIGHYGEMDNDVYCSLYSLIDTQQGHPRWSALWGYNSDSMSFFPLSSHGFDMMEAGRGYWLEMDVNDTYVPSTECFGGRSYCGDGYCDIGECGYCFEDCGICVT